MTIPVFISYVLFLVLQPLIPIICKFGISQKMGSIIVFVGFLFLATYPVITVAPALKKEAEKIQFYIPKVDEFLRSQFEKVKIKVKDTTGLEITQDIPLEILKYTTVKSKEIILKIPTLLGSILEWTFVIPLFLFFILKDHRRFRMGMLRITPNFIFERFYHLYYHFNKKLGDYIFAKLIEASIVGIVITGGLLIIGVKFAFLLGLIAAITNIIPYVGPIIGAIPAIVFGMAEYGTSSTYWAILMLFIIANFLDLALVFPILISKIVDLHPVVVVVSVIVGSQLMGLVGMIISIPLAAAAKLIFQEVFREIYASGQK